ncbi:hypothetical protein [Peribacillus asahii]|uniref:Uncharacterized protein n=1 Tax=Peribacillus asahii TaxID=228899 RepID=A0A3Q9RNP0_9BACI|nr:hypothetical protein [Peribacillus asahii]AZV43248.1 hypothetical protein BAOM_2639 [Peribacillus asahii]USK83322.1 hypothetical protein LIT35_12580 [Peribacillus asahii]
MAICPLCNAFKELEMHCTLCGTLLDDSGKVSDFLDPYGHYNDEETAKMGDGYPNTARDQICPHLMSCKSCGHDQVVFIQEE